MDLRGWDERYRSELENAPPTPVLQSFIRGVTPGKALDLAAGTGRNALWLAEQGWDVTAVDGASAAVQTLTHRALSRGLKIATETADLRGGRYILPVDAFNFVLIAYYLQRDLIEPAKAAVRPGGLMLTIVHTTEDGEEPTENRLRLGELRRYFKGWEILHDFEGKPSDPAHRRAVAEIGAMRPTRS